MKRIDRTDIAFGIALIVGLSLLCAAATEAMSLAVQLGIPVHDLAQWQRDLLAFGICMAGPLLVLGLFGLALVIATARAPRRVPRPPYRVRLRKLLPPDEVKVRIEEWRLDELIEAAWEAYEKPSMQARHRLERAIEGIEE